MSNMFDNLTATNRSATVIVQQSVAQGQSSLVGKFGKRAIKVL